jgi:hypothetical protein
VLAARSGDVAHDAVERLAVRGWRGAATGLAPLRSELGVDFFEELSELGEALAAEPRDEALLELSDDLAGDRVYLGAASGGADEPRAAVGGIADALDVAMALKVGDELGHRLLGDLRSPGQLAHGRALGVEELQDVAVRRAHGGVASRGEALVKQLVSATDGLAQEHAEVRLCPRGRQRSLEA